MGKTVGILLLLNALAVFVGLFLKSMEYWYIVDYCMIVVSVIGGYLLLKDK